MIYIIPYLLLWIVAGLAVGEMVIEGALSAMEELSLGDNFAAAILMFTFAALLGLPWLLWRAIDEGIHSIFRR